MAIRIFYSGEGKLHVTALKADVHGSSKGRVITAKHPVNVVNNDLMWMFLGQILNKMILL